MQSQVCFTIIRQESMLLPVCRFDASMHDACEQDLLDLCSVTLKEMEDNEEKKRSGLTCLQQFKEELKNRECR